MSVRPILAVAALAAAALLAPMAPAAAADLAGPPAAVSLCGPPPAALSEATPSFLAWMAHGGQPIITDVQRYDPHHPPAALVPKYVVPETAYLASPLCQFPDGVSTRSWYDGKLFYIQGGNRSAPDTFMVIERR
jgi:hypothetical protein